jgi:hypothetical protein
MKALFYFKELNMSFNYKTRGFTTAAMVAALVLCGLGLFGCAYQAIEEESPTKVDEDGRRLVDFSVPTEFYGGGGKSLKC